MHRSNGNLLRKLGILAVITALALGVVSCSSDDPVTPVDDDPIVNRAPGTPTIDTAEGAPADGAVDVPTTITLHWDCTDADGDTLTYTLHFGSADNPPAISIDQAENSYGPMSMVNETTFYWQIVAKDREGETTASPVWSYTTIAGIPETETISVPNAPTGPATGETDETLLFSAIGAVSNLGHTVEYQFDWGNSWVSSYGTGSDRDFAYEAAGTFDVKVRARCSTHTDIISDWSSTFSVTISDPAVETIETPDAPSGPATGSTNETLTYSTSVVSSSLGHTVAYTFDWGDGADTTVGTTQTTHYWPAVGTYDVKVMAYCQTHPEIESDWSAVTQVTISVPGETIVTPQMRTNISDITGVGEEEWVSCYDVTSNLGHDLEYRFDLENDGTYTAWSTYSYVFHTWSTAGTYTLRAQARCVEHPEILSDWTTSSYDHEIVVNDGVETISTPTFQPTGTIVYTTAQNMVYGASGAVSSLGHSLEYQFDWGNGEFSTWGTINPAYIYPNIGVFEARVMARCRDHIDIMSEWSATNTVTIVEAITKPTISGPSTGVAGNPITFTTPGSTSSEGHDLEYRLYISTSYSNLGDPMEWTTIDNLTHSFAYARTWYVRVQARCIADLTESGTSDFHSITISAK